MRGLTTTSIDKSETGHRDHFMLSKFAFLLVGVGSTVFHTLVSSIVRMRVWSLHLGREAFPASSKHASGLANYFQGVDDRLEG